MPKISIQHVYKIYDNGTKAVDDFNLDIEDNEFIVFVGPSGCGKSTTLRMIAGLEDITAGDLLIDGVLSNALEPKERDMAMVFQNYALYPHMTVYDNMAFGLRIKHVPKPEIDMRVKEAAKILDIVDQLDKKPKAMSGGQRQRVALGRAIVRKPKVFLLDEPLSNLDAKLRSSMRSEITKLHNVLRTTFIYVTHDQIEAMTMGTKIVVMKKGVIQQVDSPMNLYDFPTNTFVAGFIGTPQMNFIDGRAFLDKHNLLINLSGKMIECPLDVIKKFEILSAIQKKEIILGIRPEHILISSQKDKNAIECKIVVVEALGNEANIICDSLDGNIHLTVKTLRNDSLRVGDKIFLAFDFAKMHLFDKETTNTLLPHVPLTSTIFAKVSDHAISLGSNKIKLSSYLEKYLFDNKEIVLSFSNDSIIEGNEFNAKIISKECINKKWLFCLDVNGQYIHYFNEKYIDGDDFNFSIDLSKVDIYNTIGDLLIKHLDVENKIKGVLSPCKRKIPYIKSTPLNENKLKKLEENSFDENGKHVKISLKNKKVFHYSFLGKDIEPSLDATNKIYALLGKKFYLHQIQYSLPLNKIRLASNDDSCVFTGNVVEKISYEKSNYYKLKAGDSEIIIPYFGEFAIGDCINFTLDSNDIGVSDINFDVKII